MKVYMLSDYEEHGAEHVTATLDPLKLPAMIDAYYASSMASMLSAPNPQTKAEFEKARLGAREALDSVLAEGPGDGMWKLQHGWGGLQLHVVELQ